MLVRLNFVVVVVFFFFLRFQKVTVKKHVANNTSIGYVFLMCFIYFGIACSSLIQVVNCHDFSHCSSTTPLMQSQLVNETRTGSPAESESYGILSENYGNLIPAEHPSKRDIFVGAQSLVTNPTTMKSLTEFLNKNSSLLVKLICECVKRTLKHFWTDYLKHLDTY